MHYQNFCFPNFLEKFDTFRKCTWFINCTGTTCKITWTPVLSYMDLNDHPDHPPSSSLTTGGRGNSDKGYTYCPIPFPVYVFLIHFISLTYTNQLLLRGDTYGSICSIDWNFFCLSLVLPTYVLCTLNLCWNNVIKQTKSTILHQDVIQSISMVTVILSIRASLLCSWQDFEWRRSMQLTNSYTQS